MACCNPIIATNAGGIPYIRSTNTVIGTDNIGYMSIIISDVIPADTTATLPVVLTMNDTTRALTLPNGTPVTAAELLNVSNILIFNDRSKGLLTLMSRTTA